MMKFDLPSVLTATAACGGIRSVPRLGDTVTLNPQPLPPRNLSAGGAMQRQ